MPTCDKCGVAVADGMKSCYTCSERKPPSSVRSGLITTFWVIVATLGVAYFYRGSPSSSLPADIEAATGQPGGVTPSLAAVPAPAETHQYIPTSCADFHKLFGLGSALTDLQKKEEFSTRLKGKWVRWSGEVVSVSDDFGLSLSVRCLPSTFSTDARVSFDGAQRTKLLSLQRGSQVQFTARLDDWGALADTRLSNGELSQ